MVEPIIRWTLKFDANFSLELGQNEGKGGGQFEGFVVGNIFQGKLKWTWKETWLFKN